MDLGFFTVKNDLGDFQLPLHQHSHVDGQRRVYAISLQQKVGFFVALELLQAVMNLLEELEFRVMKVEIELIVHGAHQMLIEGRIEVQLPAGVDHQIIESNSLPRKQLQNLTLQIDLSDLVKGHSSVEESLDQGTHEVQLVVILQRIEDLTDLHSVNGLFGNQDSIFKDELVVLLNLPEVHVSRLSRPEHYDGRVRGKVQFLESKRAERGLGFNRGQLIH